MVGVTYMADMYVCVYWWWSVL